MDQPIDVLLSAAGRGDSAAFEQLYHYAYPTVHQECLAVLRNPIDAEDAVQDSYVRIYRKLDTLQNPEKFLPWCKRIAHNCSVGLIEKRRKKAGLDELRPPVTTDEQAGLDLLDEPDSELSPEDKTEEIVLRGLLQKKIDSLSPKRATCLALYEQGYTYDEIGEQLSIPAGTVKSNVFYARKALKAELDRIERKEKRLIHGFCLVPLGMTVQVQSGNQVPPGFIQAERTGRSARQEEGWKQVARTLFPGLLAPKIPVGKQVLAVVLSVLLIAGGIVFMVAWSGRNSPAPTKPQTRTTSQNQKTASGSRGTESHQPATQGTDLVRRQTPLAALPTAGRSVPSAAGLWSRAGGLVPGHGPEVVPAVRRGNPMIPDEAGGTAGAAPSGFLPRVMAISQELADDSNSLGAAQTPQERWKRLSEAAVRDGQDLYNFELDTGDQISQ